MRDDVIDALAAFRITRLIVDDVIFERPRAHVTEALRVAGYTKAIELLECYWCTGTYVAASVVVARRLAPRAWDPLAKLLAFSAVTGVIDRVVA